MEKEPDILSIEAGKALAAGMTYGKWKALNYKPVEKEPEPLPQYISVCQNCRQQFEHYTSHAKKFCCDKCRNAFHYRRNYRLRKEREQNECLQMAQKEIG